MNNVAVCIGQDLHLNVQGAFDQLLQIDLVIAKGGACFRASSVNLRGELGLRFQDAHATSAAAPACLQHQRETDEAGKLHRLRQMLRERSCRRHDGDVDRLRQLACLDLVAEKPKSFGGGADKSEARACAGFGKFGVLGQETITGMDRICPGAQCRSNDILDIKIGLNGRFALTDEVAFISLKSVQREAILGRINADRPNAQLACGTEDANCDLAAIGNEYRLDRLHIRED